MSAENAAAPVLAGRGCEKCGVLEMRRIRTTTLPLVAGGGA